MTLKQSLSFFRHNFQDKMRVSYVKRRYKARIHHDISILCSNCLGAVVSHDFGLRFNSPTVNLWMSPADFTKFVGNLDYYLSKKVKEIIPSPKPYPCGCIEDITIYFLHYKSFEEAEKKWEERKKRIDPENIFVIMVEKDGCTYENLKQFDQLTYKKKVVFTHKNYPEIQSAYCIKGFEKKQDVSNILAYRGRWLPIKYYDQFNFAKWFMEL